MLNEDINKPVKSRWANPNVFAPKGNGLVWFCVELRKLDAVTVRDSFQISQFGRVLSLVERSTHLLNLRWKLRLLASRKHRTKPCEDHPYLSSPTVPVCTGTVRTGKCTCRLLKGNGRYHVICEVAVAFRLPTWYSRLFENNWTILSPPSTYLDATARCPRNT